MKHIPKFQIGTHFKVCSDLPARNVADTAQTIVFTSIQQQHTRHEQTPSGKLESARAYHVSQFFDRTSLDGNFTRIGRIGLCRSATKKKVCSASHELKRKKEGEFYTLYKKLLDDEDRFFKYFRMSKYEFETIVTRIKPMITKQDKVQTKLFVSAIAFILAARLAQTRAGTDKTFLRRMLADAGPCLRGHAPFGCGRCEYIYLYLIL